MTEKDIEIQTKKNERYIESIRLLNDSLQSDYKKTTRLYKKQCRKCFYLESIALQRLTTSYCEICGKKIVNGSTNVDVICQECASEHTICVKCGGKI